MSRIDEINSILDGLGEGATFDQVEYALRGYEKREVIDVLADRSLAAGGTFNGGTITEPLNIEVPADDESYLFFLQAPEDYDQGFGEMIQVQDFSGNTIFSLNIFGQITIRGGAATLDLLAPTNERMFVTDGGQAPFLQAENTVGKHVFKVLPTGVTIIGAVAAPADGDLVAGQMALWFDATNGSAKLKIKAKQANGTVVQGEVALT